MTRGVATKRILLVDDEWGLHSSHERRLIYGDESDQWILTDARDDSGEFSVDVAVECVSRRLKEISVVLLDVAFGPNGTPLGLDILQRLRSIHPTLPILMFSSLSSERHRELVIQCLKLGAHEFVAKDAGPERLKLLVQDFSDPTRAAVLHGNSEPMRELRATVARVAMGTEVPVLIVGASGTGKELVARSLHRQGSGRVASFVAKNCAHAEGQLLESELFGHKRGAFTGAEQDRVGLLEEANGGTLFLDEIADMPLETQGKLLRVLESKAFRRLGASDDIDVRFRLVCATNAEPAQLLEAGKMREDFFFRIATVTIAVPPLADRRLDIPVLAEHFLERFTAGEGQSYPARRLSADASRELRERPWPGNVRELRNAIERAVIFSRTEVIESIVPSARTTADEDSRPSDVDAQAGNWARDRIHLELRMAVDLKRCLEKKKGARWRSEFMRRLYPGINSPSTRGLLEVERRLKRSVWAYPAWEADSEIVALMNELFGD